MSDFWSAKIENGLIVIEPLQKDSYMRFLASNEGKDVELTINEGRGQTEKQRALYWRYLRQIGKEIGDEPESLHEQFKDMFLRTPAREGTTSQVGSTRGLTVKEFQEYIEKIRRRVATVGIVLED